MDVLFYFFLSNNLIPLTGKLFLLTELKSAVFDDFSKEEEWKVQFCLNFYKNSTITWTRKLYYWIENKYIKLMAGIFT